ncbi:MAG: phosphoheptose isomerase, partial [Parasphingorhabdus sp.]|nr:phosphoheptose isomerase [Parasphingorhabdus sp.]
MKLEREIVEKPWGRTGIPPTFGADKKRQVGEICFKAGPSVTPGLLVKYLFTSEKLSVQVHPDNRQARKRGALNGKDECW